MVLGNKCIKVKHKCSKLEKKFRRFIFQSQNNSSYLRIWLQLYVTYKICLSNVVFPRVNVLWFYCVLPRFCFLGNRYFTLIPPKQSVRCLVESSNPLSSSTPFSIRYQIFLYSFVFSCSLFCLLISNSHPRPICIFITFWNIN